MGAIMIVYKITNKINGKVYIGQTSKSLKERFQRHCCDAMSDRLDTHFARAIRKYGKENFSPEIIDTATSEEELNEKERYWIHYYDSLNNGYNETDSIFRSGGNTYRAKTDEEMDIIKQKIRQTKLGGKNPNSKRVKCRNEKTGEILHFDSMAEVRDYFQQSNHQFVSKRCLGTIQSLWNQTWNFAYEEEDFRELSVCKKQRKATNIRVLNLKTKEEKEFPSYAAAERYFNLPNKSLSGHAYKQKQKGVTSFVAQKIYFITILD